MSYLQTVRLKPNPSGKDRTKRGVATATQLGAEWVDLKNIASTDIKLEGVKLYHIAYDQNGNGRWEAVMSFRGTLGAGKIMRIHSGNGDVSDLKDEDMEGANHHLFTGRDNYVWNNDYGDCSALWQSGSQSPFDKACYDANSPEGVVLVRSGDKLIATATSASRW